jgi:hypothetical protein
LTLMVVPRHGEGLAQSRKARDVGKKRKEWLKTLRLCVVA